MLCNLNNHFFYFIYIIYLLCIYYYIIFISTFIRVFFTSSLTFLLIMAHVMFSTTPPPWSVLKEHAAGSLTTFLLFVFLQMAHYVLHFTVAFQRQWLIRHILCFCFSFNFLIYTEKSTCVTKLVGFSLIYLLDLSSNGDLQWWGEWKETENQLRMNFSQCHFRDKKIICTSFLARTLTYIEQQMTLQDNVVPEKEKVSQSCTNRTFLSVPLNENNQSGQPLILLSVKLPERAKTSSASDCVTSVKESIQSASVHVR